MGPVLALTHKSVIHDHVSRLIVSKFSKFLVGKLLSCNFHWQYVNIWANNLIQARIIVGLDVSQLCQIVCVMPSLS